MLRRNGSAALAFVLSMSTCAASFAAPVGDQSALAPGKPAGVREAALHAPLWVWVAGIGFVALGIALVASGNSNGTSSGSSTSGLGVGGTGGGGGGGGTSTSTSP